MKIVERLKQRVSRCPPKEQLATFLAAARDTTVHENSWGILLRAESDDEGEDEAVLFWFDNQDVWLQDVALLLAAFASASDLAFAKIYAVARAEMMHYLTGEATQEDLVFRWEGLAHQIGLSLLWAGSYSDLVISDHPIAIQTRLFCRRFLADTGVVGIHCYDTRPLENEYRSVFMECLADFGQGGQGLDIPVLQESRTQ